MTVQIKQLKEKKTDEIFYPVTVGQGVVFEDDSTNADITEEQMDLVFDWNRNYIDLTPTVGNYIILTWEDDE